jgi:hypothetical protein
MALSEDQLVYSRRQIGNKPLDAELNTIFDRVGNVDQLVLEVLETRYAELIRNPATFSVSGEYSQSTAENIKALAKRITAWRAYMVSIGLEVGPDLVGSAVGIVTPANTPWR